MAPDSGGDRTNAIINGIWYTLPRLIAKPISAILAVYFPDLFIHTFEWKPGDFGLVTSIYSLARAISYFALGFIFKFAVDNPKISGDDNKKIDITNAITVASILLYTVTFMFLVVLPIYWTGGNTHTFYILSRLKTLRGFNHLETLLSKIFPEIGIVRPAPKPPPLPPYFGCFNNRACGSISSYFASSWRFARSRIFVAIFIVILHAASLSSYELCNRAMPTYIEKDDKNLKTMTGINQGAYAITFLGSILAVSSIKHFYGHLITDAELFLISGLFFLIVQIPILLPFVKGVGGNQNNNQTGQQQTSVQCSCCCKTQSCNPPCACACCCGNKTPKPSDWCQLISMIVLHGSINFWTTASAPALEYVCTHIVIGNQPLRNFGPLVLLLSAAVATVAYTVCNEVIGANEGGTSSVNCTCPGGSEPCQCTCSAGGQNCCCSQDSSYKTTDMILTIFTILGQSFIYILMYKYDYWWNKGNWLHFLLIGLSGTVCGLFMLNINNMQNSVVKKECFKDWKWLIIGMLFSFMYLTTAVGIYLMYKVYDVPKIVNHSIGCIRWTFVYNFDSVYKIITIFYQILNAIAATVYFVPAALLEN